LVSEQEGLDVKGQLGNYQKWLIEVAKLNMEFSSYRFPRRKEHKIKKQTKLEPNIVVKYECRPCGLTFPNFDLYEIHQALNHKGSVSDE